MSKKTVPCGCIDGLSFGEPAPDCSMCQGSGLMNVIELVPEPRPPRESQIQTEVRLERERCVTIVRDRAGGCRGAVGRLGQLGYGVGAKAYRELAIELDELAEFMARGPLDR